MPCSDSISYDEKSEKLAIRIGAHRNYSKFSLEDWLLKKLPLKQSDVLLDVGCGGGNFFKVYDELVGLTGVIVGIDKSAELLEAAARVETACKKVLLEWDMDVVLPFVAASFDLVISTFSIYYALDCGSILNGIRKSLKAGGQLCLIGPTDKNASELYALNKRVFGIARYQEADRRTRRLETEFMPAVKNAFSQTRAEIIDSKIVFPDKRELMRYYMATLLFEESGKKTGKNFKLEDLLDIEWPEAQISKEMIVIWGKK